ncbi:MAG: DUF362 domain-containing protein [Candidatus Zixiibacteriota bacterium]|nr:MAG: DUF362 domain-containing protein [candidate division Zixibacteria bacterium]
MTSTVLRTGAAADARDGLSQKFRRLLEASNLSRFVGKGDLVAVKMHLGEKGNVRYLRPIYAVMLVEALKELGARPFVTDTPVLYRSPRREAWSYYEVARRHGFTAEVLGCPLVISGGLKDRSVPVDVPHPLRLPRVGISTEIYDAEALISLAHVTLHMQFPLGAALKNLGMGCVDIETKLAMHEARGAANRLLSLQEAMVDGAAAVLDKFRDKFYAFNLMLDVTPDCDCWDRTDVPVVPDLGILAGTDPVALDRAAYDLIIAAPGYPGSREEGSGGMAPGGAKVQPIYPKIDPDAYFHITERAAIGSTLYEFQDV